MRYLNYLESALLITGISGAIIGLIVSAVDLISVLMK